MRITNRHMKKWLFNVLFILGTAITAFCVSATPDTTSLKPDARYLLTVNKQNQTMTVELCVENTMPVYLTNSNPREARRIQQFNQGKQALSRTGSKVYPETGKDNCLNYHISTKSTNRLQSEAHIYRSLIINTQSWLWYHPDFHYVSINVQDKRGKPLSTFFPFLKSGNLYQFKDKGLQWESKTIIDHVQTFRLPLGKSHLQVAIAGVAQVRAHDWLNWIKRTAASVESIYGHYPVNSTRVLVIPIGQRSGPIPWGEVQRGGYPSVHFYIDETRSNAEFLNDWTGSHELSHVLLPKVRGRDRWLSEGIASYYQNVARAKHGLLPSTTAWRKLTEGFERGRRAAGTTPLQKANKIMHVYWGGVAYFFLADLRLREKGSSLPDVLQQFHECCLPSFEMWHAESLSAKLDALSDSQIFSDLLNHEANARQFPVSSTFENSTNNQLLQKHLPAILTSPKESE